MSLVKDVLGLFRREELPFLHADCLAGLRGRCNEVCLPAEKRGDLQDVQNLRRAFGLLALVDVGEER